LKVTLNWIKEFLDVDKLDPENIAKMLTMSGTEVKNFSLHPDADKLSICEVDVGVKKLNIVCGAKNFKNGDRVAVALPGAVINGITIKKSEIRGQVSEGMMCSEMELGLSSDSEGIMILDSNCIVGEGFAKSIGLDDIVYELEITPNRPDCLSVINLKFLITTLRKD